MLQGAQARRDAGYVLSIFGRYAEAVAYVEQAQATYRQLGERVLEARATMNLGILSRYRGDQDAALAAYASARDLATAAGDARVAVIALNNASVVYLNRGHLSAAQAALEDALQRQGTVRDQLTADILGNLGSVYQSQGQLELAREYLTRSIDLQEELGNTFATMHEREALGSVLVLLDQPAEGQRLLEHVAERAEQGGAREPAAQARAGLGRILLAQGRAEEAVVQMRRAVAIARSANADALALVLADLASAASASGRPAEALAAADEVVAIAERLGSRSRVGLGEGARGTALAALGREDEAAAAFERSIRATEEVRDEMADAPAERRRFLEARMEPFEGLLALHARRGRAEQALAQTERARARVLLDALQRRTGPARRDAGAGRARPPARAARGAGPGGRRGAARGGGRRFDGGGEGLRRGETARRASFVRGVPCVPPTRAIPAWRRAAGARRAWRIEDAQGLLDDRTLALTYAVAQDRTYLFALTRRGGVALHEVPLGRTALAQRTRRFREALGDRRLEVVALGRALCADLLGPVRKQLRVEHAPLDRARRAAVGAAVPGAQVRPVALPPGRARDRVRALAHGAARDDGASRAARRPGATRSSPWAIRPSASRSAGRSRRCCATARSGRCPTRPPRSGRIERFYAPGSSVYVGPDASETRVKAEAGQHRVLHFAAHGILNDASPLYSQLVLARPAAGEGDDGLLEAWEIMEMSLPADLAVLSACESGRGRVSQGEGLVGLSWAFSVAGCPTTVVSQWKVDSRSTSRLMRRFHRDLADGRPTADALRTAALAVKADPRYAHPFYWAGFVVVGPGWTERAASR